MTHVRRSPEWIKYTRFYVYEMGKQERSLVCSIVVTIAVDRDIVADNYCSGSRLDDGTAMMMILPASPVMIWA